MTLLEIKNHIMHQTNNDADDLGDFLPFLEDYINEGYDKLVVAYAGEHVSEDSENFTRLTNDRSTPNLPDWAHRAIADWATWLVYRNGNTQKQNRGTQYRYAFEQVVANVRGMLMDAETGYRTLMGDQNRKFINIPR